VLHDVHTSQCRNIVEETAKIVLGVTSRYNFRHSAILAKIAVTAQVSQGRGGHFVCSAEIENRGCDITTINLRISSCRSSLTLAESASWMGSLLELEKLRADAGQQRVSSGPEPQRMIERCRETHQYHNAGR
jgi:hypothetical protein